MAQVAIAKRDSEGTEIHAAQQFKKGDKFKVIDKHNPENFMAFVVTIKLQEDGLFEQATLVEFNGDSMIVFFEEETEQAWGIHDYFTIEEAE